MRLLRKDSSVTHSLLVMRWNMIDHTAWQRNKALSHTCYLSLYGVQLMRLSGKEYRVSLTACWDKMWLMRLSGKETKYCHSLPVGHGRRHDRWDCLAKKQSSVTYSLLVMGWDMIDETAWQCHSLAEVGHEMRLPGKHIKLCHSLAVGHGMRHDWWDCLAMSLTS